MILDSGKRTEFPTGAVRDIDEEKGRCDLLPLTLIGDRWQDRTLFEVGRFRDTGDAEHLWRAFCYFSGEILEWSVAETFMELSIHYKEGCNKYGVDNWMKGINISSYISSAVRHYLKYTDGWTDERHDRAFLWNILCAIWTLKNLPEMDDVPHREYIPNKVGET